jgi:hypothetical protein
MTTVGSSGANAFFGAVAVTLLVIMYGQWLYRSKRLRRLQERLRSRVAVVRELIADGERTETAYADSSDPSSAHGRFLRRWSADSPEIMGIGPVPATRKALARAGLTMADIDVVELNEAFASQAVACMRELGISLERTNIDGGAVALGHPLGATGARITGKAAQILRREGKRYALATQCIGGGQGIATVLEAA